MVMTAPSRTMIWGTNDQTTKGSSGVVQATGERRQRDEQGHGRVVVRRALRPLRSYRVFFDRFCARYDTLRADPFAWQEIETERAVESGALRDNSS